MSKAVRIDAFGGVDRLRIVDVPKPQPAPGRIVVRVVAAGTNPGEIAIREGALKDQFPMDFPFGQGTDFAGVVDGVGSGVTGFSPGDDVLGWIENRSAQAEYVVAEPDKLVRKPPSMDWYSAGSLHVAGTTAVACVRAVNVAAGDVVAVSGAAGGVGFVAAQLAVRKGARVIGIASEKSAPFLRSVGVEAIAYGDGLEDRLRRAAPGGVNAWIDVFGGGYVELALELGVSPERINTVIDFAAVEKHGVKAQGSAEASDIPTFVELADLIAYGALLYPIAAIYPFAELHAAYDELAKRKSHGKIVLSFDPRVTKASHPANR